MFHLSILRVSLTFKKTVFVGHVINKTLRYFAISLDGIGSNTLNLYQEYRQKQCITCT